MGWDMKKADARRWPLGHMAIMRDCKGGSRVKGQVVMRETYSVTLRLKDGTYLAGGTELLEEPTGLVWPYEKDNVWKALPGSWDRREVRAIRRGLPLPQFKPWIKPKEKPVATDTSGLSDAERAKQEKRERARQRRLARKARGGKG